MKASVYPQKRNKNLSQLSHEHHHGLVFADYIQKGVKNKTDVSIIREFVINFWDKQLQSHFYHEEKLLLPFLNKDLLLVQQFLSEHEEIKTLLTHIYIANTCRYDVLTKIAVLLKEHIRFEERELFPYLEKFLSAQQLIAIGTMLNDYKKEQSTFQPKFWENKK